MAVCASAGAIADARYPNGHGLPASDEQWRGLTTRLRGRAPLGQRRCGRDGPQYKRGAAAAAVIAMRRRPTGVRDGYDGTPVTRAQLREQRSE